MSSMEGDQLKCLLSSRSGLNDLYAASQKSLDVEINLRQQLEQEVELLRRQREEKEV